ncbi:MAG: hypothetical protein JW809_20170 [Pirellulales bacterium]|nr:hypothetical protein [Pirellulales bacterium]
MTEFNLNDELRAVETALRSIRLAPPGLDRDRLLYEAGRASARRSRAGRLAGVLAAAAAVAVAFVAGRNAAGPTSVEVVERIVFVADDNQPDLGFAAAPSASPRRESPDERGLATVGMLNRLIAEGGIDALPHAPLVLPIGPPPDRAPTVRGWRGDAPG